MSNLRLAYLDDELILSYTYIKISNLIFLYFVDIYGTSTHENRYMRTLTRYQSFLEFVKKNESLFTAVITWPCCWEIIRGYKSIFEVIKELPICIYWNQSLNVGFQFCGHGEYISQWKIGFVVCSKLNILNAWI